MTTVQFFIILLFIAFFGGCVGYFLGSGIVRATIERHYHLIKKEEK